MKCPHCMHGGQFWDLGDDWAECPECGHRFDTDTGDTVRHDPPEEWRLTPE